MHSPTYISIEEFINKFEEVSQYLADPSNPTDEELDFLESVLIKAEQYIDSYVGGTNSIGSSCSQLAVFPRCTDCCSTKCIGSFDAGSGVFPTDFARGNFWKVSTDGIVGVTAVSVGDYIIANTSRGSRANSNHFDVFKGECVPLAYCFIPWQVKEAALYISFYLFNKEESLTSSGAAVVVDDSDCGGSFSIGSLKFSSDSSSSSSSSSSSDSDCGDDFLCTEIGKLFSNLLKGFRSLTSSF